ncbi:MAG: hypothetical protein GY797_16815 [Deltaproteobacteria bacterium]|nr:hypothetical protein [Deltaproteobacteria bacterium]
MNQHCSLRTLIHALHTQGLTAFEDGRAKTSTFKPTLPPKASTSLQVNDSFIKVDLGISNMEIHIPIANRNRKMPVRQPIIYFLILCIFTFAPLSCAYNGGPARVLVPDTADFSSSEQIWSFTGKYLTNWGIIHLEQFGSQVIGTGTHEFDKTGVNGNKISGLSYYYGRSYPFYFMMSRDGQYIKGAWGVKNIDENLPWHGKRSGIPVAVSRIENSTQKESSNPEATSRLKVLSESMYANDITEIRKLIEAEADVNVINKFGATPLYSASGKGHTEVVKLLLDAGSDVNKTKHNGVTALYIASGKGHTEVVKLLLVAGADANIASQTEATPLYRASEKRHADVVRLLLEAGADANKAESTLGATPLSVASQKGYAEIVKLLLFAGADVNKALLNGWTPLYTASRNGYTEVVKILKTYGARE